MRLIDEKGRLFGKINIIDFLVISFLISLTPMFYFVYKILNKTRTETIPAISQAISEVKEEPKREFLEIDDVDCLFIKLEPQIAKVISVGDKEVDNKGQIIAEILKIGQVSPYVYEFNIGAERKLLKNDPEFKQIPVTLKIKAEVKQDNLYYKDKQILDNSSIVFATSKYQLEGILRLKELIKSTSLDVEPKKDDLTKIDSRMNTLESKINTLDSKIDAMNTLESRIATLEEKIKAILSSPKLKKKNKR